MRIALQETNVFTFNELSESAQQKAIDNARELSCSDSFWYGHVIDDAKRLAAMVGIDIDNIYFSGFCSQGDGAQFTGRYGYAKGGTAALIAEAPQDSKLHEIAKGLQEVQRRNFYRLHARVKSSGHYLHSGCTSIRVYRETDYSYCDDPAADTVEIVSQLLRDFMDWIYTRLETEYKYQTSETVAREWLEDCGQEFTANGELY